MAEYIEKEKELRDWPLCDEPADAYQFIRNYPSADVVERKKGEWKRHLLDNGDFWANYCSECGTYLPYGLDWEPNFCPHCSADMR